MKTVLLVDDDDDIVFITQYFLESKGYTVLVDNTGERVLEIVAGRQPDVILLDVKLPYKNGIEICQTVKQAADIPVILFSAHENSADILKTSQADDFLKKPFDIDALADTISKHLQR